MGTSISGSGPGDKNLLLPSWALPNQDNNDKTPDDSSPEPEQTDTTPPPANTEVPETGNPAPNSRPPEPGTSSPATTEIPFRRWTAAKRRLSKAVSGHGEKNKIEAACRGYVRAHGGSRKAAQSAVSARTATARLGGFLANVANHGIRPALQSLGLDHLIGKNAHIVFAAIVDAIAPEGADTEQASVREAVEQTLANLYDQYIGVDGDITELDAMSSEAVKSGIEASVAASIFNRWLGELAKIIEKKAITASSAVKIERDVEAFIYETVKLDLSQLDPLKIQWDGAEGKAITNRIFEDAYSLLGEEP